MVYKNFRFQIILRLILISGTIGLILYFVLVTGQYLRSIYLVVLFIVLLAEFIYYIDKSNRDFTAFLLAILQDDFSTKFMEKGKGKSFQNFYQTLNNITRKFKAISAEKEMQFLYLETLVEHVKVGIISFDDKGNVHLINNTLKNLLDRPVITKIQSLENIDPELLKIVENIKPTENKMLKISISNNLLHLSFYCSEFKLKDRHFKLISMQNIKNEMEAQELDAWQKLIRVLTHEIMNSVTPITSLTGTLQDILYSDKKSLSSTNGPTVEKLEQGLQAIKNRSEGLQTFTRAYKNLTRIPQPNFQKVSIKEIFDRIKTLMNSELEEAGVKLYLHFDNEGQEIVADPELLEQVIINLIKNAIEATQEVDSPRIRIQVKTVNLKTEISITDNGIGIPEDKLEQIFVPFFTTKKKGSGIGLAVSRQILRLHDATITANSTEGSGTQFIIRI